MFLLRYFHILNMKTITGFKEYSGQSKNSVIPGQAFMQVPYPQTVFIVPSRLRVENHISTSYLAHL